MSRENIVDDHHDKFDFAARNKYVDGINSYKFLDVAK